jgi:hypothetical protein
MLLASTALMAALLHATPAVSDSTTVRETVTQTPGKTTVEKTVTTSPAAASGAATKWSTETHSIAATGARVVNFMDFDLNKDGILSINEVGKMLFKLYDTDGNDVIDNNEYERRAVVTVMPMEKNTVISYDFDGDGIADKTQYTQETFMQDTLLTKFDKNKDGLSPHEFMGMDFLAADVNRDKVIDLKEWQGSYIPGVDKLNKEKASVNK